MSTNAKDLAGNLQSDYDPDAEYTLDGAPHCILMPCRAARAWNQGRVTDWYRRQMTISIPGRSGGRSYVRDGMIVVMDGLPTSTTRTPNNAELEECAGFIAIKT